VGKKGKRNDHLYAATIVAYAASAALLSQTEPAYSLGQGSKPAVTDFGLDCSYTAIRSHSLSF